MTDKEYEQKRRECWEEAVMHGALEVDKDLLFDHAFKCGYALGKQKETISQEEIEKAAEEYSQSLGKNRDVTWNDGEYGFIAGANFALGKQEKDADAVIQGWVARDNGGFISLFSYRPDRVIHNDLGFWGHNDGSDEIDLPRSSFPDLTWDSDPIEVELIIKRKNNG